MLVEKLNDIFKIIINTGAIERVVSKKNKKLKSRQQF